MKREEIIERYGKEEYKRRLEQNKKYNEQHPEKMIANGRERCRKGGKRYDKQLEHQQTGIPGEKHKIRKKHGYQYRPFKMIIAPDSQIHHEWIGDTAEYRGVALVEADQHMHGFVDVIEILDGKITLLTEEEVKNGKKNSKEEINKNEQR